MSQIRFNKVTIGTKPLFKNINLTISAGNRVGIVGDNGVGKSTFLNCIARHDELQDGEIISPKGLKFGFIEQELTNEIAGKTLYEAMSQAIPLNEKEYSLWKIDATLDAFKAPKSIYHKQVKELSGGWQRLTAIARTVLTNPDVLLLDEPTNHLDVEKIFILEKWLNEQNFEGPLVIVSHDRSFLANCTNKTFFLRDAEIIEYAYPYEKSLQLLREHDKTLENRRSKELHEINRLKRSAHELRQIGVNNYSSSALKKSNQIVKRAENIETKLTTIYIEEKRNLKLSSQVFYKKDLIHLENINVYTPLGEKLFYIKELNIVQGDRLVILGKNGSGKSQFLKLLQHVILNKEKMEGVSIAAATKFGFIDQNMSHLPLNSAIHEYIQEISGFDAQRTTAHLAHAGFPVSKKKIEIRLLSPGQRARLAFLALHLVEPNFYIMDEPTNYLDIAGQEQLENEILKASSIVVSHDRAFTQNIGTKYYMINNKHLTAIDSLEKYYQLFHEKNNDS